MKAYNSRVKNVPKNPFYISQCNVCKYYIFFSGKEKLSEFCGMMYRPKENKNSHDKITLYLHCPNCRKREKR